MEFIEIGHRINARRTLTVGERGVLVGIEQAPPCTEGTFVMFGAFFIQKGNQIKLTQKVDKMSLSFTVLKDIYAIKDQLMLLYGVANQASE